MKERFKAIETQDQLHISTDDVKGQVRKASNWKALGPDSIQDFRLKKVHHLHDRIATQLNLCLEQGNVPEWMVTGKIHLIMKDEKKGTAVTNYRPNACLNLQWKHFTRVIAHLERQNVLPEEQKGCRKGSKGNKK